MPSDNENRSKDYGWVKIWRQLWLSDIWTSGEPFDKRSAWIDLILLANHAPHTIKTKDGEIRIERGQLHTSIRKLAKRWHWSKDKVRRFLDDLERLGMCDRKRDGKRDRNGTTLSIEKYAFFQDRRDTYKDTNKSTGKTQTRRPEDYTGPGRLERLPATSDEVDDIGPPIFVVNHG